MVSFPCISPLNTNICVITGRRGRNNELSILYVGAGRGLVGEFIGLWSIFVANC